MDISSSESSLWRIGIALCCAIVAPFLFLLPGQSRSVNIVLALLTLMIATWMLMGLRSDKKKSAIQPWARRKDWSRGCAKSDLQQKPIVRWVVACALCVFVVSMFAVLPALIKSFTGLLTFLVFLTLAIYCLMSSIQSTIRWRRFGATAFHFNSLPFSLGGKLSGYIHMSRNALFPEGLSVRLACLRIIHYKNRDIRYDYAISRQEITLWSADQFITPESIALSPSGGRLISMNFALPSDAPETLDEYGNQIVWRLAVNPGNGVGNGYCDSFKVPVFRTRNNMQPGIVGDENPQLEPVSAQSNPR